MLTAGGLLLFLALPCFIIMAVVGVGQSAEHRRYRALVKTRATPLAHARPGQLVALRGRAVASDQGRVTAPVTGRQVLAYQVEVQEWVQAGRSVGPGGGAHRALQLLADQRAFWLDDGSGSRAWIAPQGARWVVPTRSYADAPGEVVGGLPETVSAWTPQIESWARGLVGASPRRLKVATRELEDGAMLNVLGKAQARHGTLCLCVDAPGQELVLSTVTNEQLSALIGRRARVFRVAGLLGVALVLAGLGLLAVGSYVWASDVGLAG